MYTEDLVEFRSLFQTSEGMRLKVVAWMTTRRCVSRVLEPPESFPLVIEPTSTTTTQQHVREQLLQHKI
jgi:hypothetical protein